VKLVLVLVEKGVRAAGLVGFDGLSDDDFALVHAVDRLNGRI